MLVESLIRLGRPFVASNESPREAISLMSDCSSPTAKNFFQHVFLVEAHNGPQGAKVKAHPYASWGHNEKGMRNREVFVPDLDRGLSIPFTMPSGGNPRTRQGYYPVPTYIIYDRDFEDFSDESQQARDKLKNFLSTRLDYTIDISISNELLELIVEAIHKEFIRFDEQGKGIIVLILTGDGESPYDYANGLGELGSDCQDLAGSELFPGKRIVADLSKILTRIGKAKSQEAATKGEIKDGHCSFCGKSGDVVSLYSKDWPWFTTTWPAPLPLALSETELVRGLALCSDCYGALTYGAHLFSKMTTRLPNWLTKQLFSPTDSRKAKENSHSTQVETIFGGIHVLPTLDKFLDDKTASRFFINGLRKMSMEGDSGDNSIGRHLENVTGFEAMLANEFIFPSDDVDLYRLTLVYFSGDPSRGDIHLRAYIEDVLPSVAVQVTDILEETAESALNMQKCWNPNVSENQLFYTKQRHRSLPYLLVTAYGVGYLWQSLADVLQRRRLSVERFIYNTVKREQELSHLLPGTLWQLREEVMFYEVFRLFLRRHNEDVCGEIDGEGGSKTVRSWRELHQLLNGDPAAIDFKDVEELGFACGYAVRDFSRWYWHQTKVGDGGKDFLRDRVMTFGSSLTPTTIWKRAISRFEEYANRVDPQGKGYSLSKQFRQLYGVILAEYSRLREEIDRNRDQFMAAFWSGYALRDIGAEHENEPTPDQS